MRLANLVPSIAADLVARLDTIGVRTETDLLFSASSTDILKRLSTGSTSLQELESAIAVVTELCAASGESSLEIFRQEEQVRRVAKKLCSGNEELDRLFHGLESQSILQISGEKGSGKSILALNLVLHHLASHPDSNAMWIDTSGEFSIAVALEILNERQIPSTILERLQVSLAFDIDSAQTLLEELRQPSSIQPTILVIDSITPLLGPLLSAVSAQGHALMIDLMRQLRSFSQTFGVTIFVINDTARQGPTTSERKPALGPSFALTTDTTLWLQSKWDAQSDTTIHSVQVLSSRFKAPQGCQFFRIESNVILTA